MVAALGAAELAGLDPGGVLADAIAERDLAGSRDIAAILDARLRHRLGSLVPLSARPWSEQVPALADPARQAYVAEIAALMDARTDRIGEHAAEHPPDWATAALGPVPSHPLDRLEWQQRAAAVGAWRELSGYDHRAIRSAPSRSRSPSTRATWYQALAGLRAAAQRGDHDHAAAQHELAGGYQALERAYRQRGTVFAQTMTDRADWPPPAPSATSSP